MSSPYYSLLKIYGDKYKEKYGSDFFPQKHHFAQAKELLTVPEDFDPPSMDEVISRLNFFFDQNDDWIISCKHNFSVFVKHFHRWIPQQKKSRKEKSKQTVLIISCMDCGTEHLSTVLCPYCYSDKGVLKEG